MGYNGVLKRQTYIIIIAILGFLVLMAGFSYALYSQNNENNNNQVIVAGDLEVIFKDKSSVISSDMIPLSDEDAATKDDNIYTFTIKNTGTLNAIYSITLQNNIDNVDDPNNMLEHEYIKFSVDNGSASRLSDVALLDENETIENNFVRLISINNSINVNEEKTHTLRIWIDKDAPTSIIGKNISLKISVAGEVATSWESLCSSNSSNLNCQILNAGGGKDYIVNRGNPDFSNPATTNEGVYAISDALGTSYYYRGAIDNNYVLFNGHSWRIVRVNGDGSIRLIDANAINSQHTMVNFSDLDVSDISRVGYDNSRMKTYLEDYYNNGDEGYNNPLVNVEDRLVEGLFINDTYLNGDNVFAGNTRITNYQPSLLKTNPNQSFGGNFNSKIGLITADEVMLAGGVTSNVNSDFYLYNGFEFYTMTPSRYSDRASLYIYGQNIIEDQEGSPLVRPVINLKATTVFSCNDMSTCGTSSDPYYIN